MGQTQQCFNAISFAHFIQAFYSHISFKQFILNVTKCKQSSCSVLKIIVAQVILVVGEIASQEEQHVEAQ